MKYTKELIEQEILNMKQKLHDNEIAHIIEDNLYSEFVKSLTEEDYTIAEIKELAALICKTEDINFERWYA